MKMQILKEMLKQAWYWVLAYFTQFILPTLKESLSKTKEYFINLLWDSLKDQIIADAKSAVEFVNKYFNSLEYQEKEKDVLDTLFKNINLPLLLRPFKPLIRKMLKDKVHEVVKKYLNKLSAKL
jgi:2-hydroxy-3-keto-5-methylthiopentenyl-1-phosphate phosphatase